MARKLSPKIRGLAQAGERYEAKVNAFALASRAMDEERNLKAGEVYEARAVFLERLTEVQVELDRTEQEISGMRDLLGSLRPVLESQLRAELERLNLVDADRLEDLPEAAGRAASELRDRIAAIDASLAPAKEAQAVTAPAVAARAPEPAPEPAQLAMF